MPLPRLPASRKACDTSGRIHGSSGENGRGAFVSGVTRGCVMGKRRTSGVRCAVCGKPVSETGAGWVHTSGKARDNGHVPQPMNAQ